MLGKENLRAQYVLKFTPHHTYVQGPLVLKKVQNRISCTFQSKFRRSSVFLVRNNVHIYSCNTNVKCHH